MRCISNDISRVGDGSITNIQGQDELVTYGFIWAMLTKQQRFSGRVSSGTVRAELKDRSKPCVFFLDEFPLLTKNDTNMSYLRMMRNVFRSFGLAVILSTTNESMRDLIKTAQHSPNQKEPTSASGVRYFVPFHDFELGYHVDIWVSSQLLFSIAGPFLQRWRWSICAVTPSPQKPM